jgi:putative endonuclease
VSSSLCYLIHFSKPIGNPSQAKGQAQHYLGYTSAGVKRRLEAHTQGRGARITHAAVLAGAELAIVRTWRPGSRRLERQLKNRKKSARFCPICNPKLEVKA